MRFIDPRTDFAFKKIFGSAESKPILISFLNALVYQGQPKIKDLEVIDPYQAAKVLGLKNTYLDVKAVLDDDTKVIIEMQYDYLQGFEQRILYNAAKGYANQLVRGQRYKELNPVIALTIANFSLFDNIPEVITYFDFKERNHLTDYPYSEITMIFVELPKFKKELEELTDITDKWIYFLSKARELDKIPESLEKEQEIKQAFVIANEASFSIEELDQIQNQEFYRLDQQRLQEMAKKAEQEKLQAEQEKMQAEQEKMQAEQEKMQAEQEKLQAEQEKLQAEQEKLQAEQEKMQAEQEKMQAEQKAQLAEQEKLQAEQKAQLAEQEKLQIETQLRQVQQEAEHQEREMKKTLVMRLLVKKFGTIDPSIQDKLSNLSTEKLEELAEIFLDFEVINDLTSWLE